MIVLVGLSIIFVYYSAVFTAKLAFEKDQGIIVVSVDALFEPRKEATVHFALKEAEQVKILKHSGNWVKTQRLDNKLGWVPRESLEPVN